MCQKKQTLLFDFQMCSVSLNLCCKVNSCGLWIKHDTLTALRMFFLFF